MKSTYMYSFAIALFLLLATSSVLAGRLSNSDVFVSAQSRYAFGSVVFVRTSGDNSQYISCAVMASTSSEVFCIARDKNNLTRSCTSTTSAIVGAARSINNASSIWFWWNADGECTGLMIDNGSLYGLK